MAFGAIWQSDIEGKHLFIDATDLSQTQATQTGFEGDILKNPQKNYVGAQKFTQLIIIIILFSQAPKIPAQYIFTNLFGHKIEKSNYYFNTRKFAAFRTLFFPRGPAAAVGFKGRGPVPKCLFFYNVYKRPLTPPPLVL